MLWIFIALLNPLLHAVANIFDNFFVNRRFSDLRALAFYTSIFNLVFLSVVFLLDKPVLPPLPMVGLLAALGAVNLLYIYPYYRALQSDDTSIVSSLFDLTQLFIPLTAFFFLDERLASQQYVGFIVIVMASALLTFDPRKFKMSRSFLFMLAASAAITVEGLIYKHLFDQGINWGTALGGQSLFSFLFALLLLLPKSSRAEIAKNRPTFLRSIHLFFAEEAFTFFGTAAGTYAITLVPLTLAKTVESFQPIFVLLLALILQRRLPNLFKEQVDQKNLLRKIILFVIMLIGVWFMAA